MKLLLAVVALLAVVFAVTSTEAVLPGFTITLSQDSLNYGVGVAMTVARAEWGKVPIPGEKGAITEPILGTLTYAVNNITLLPNPILPDPVISFVPSVGVLLHFSGASFAMSAVFDYDAPTWKMNGTGTADITVTNLTVDVGISIVAKNDRPFLGVVRCDALIGDIKIVLGGGATWMQSWMEILKKTIISELQAEIVNMTSTYVDQMGNQLLQSFPTKEPVLGLAEIDFSLVADPLFTADSLSFFCKGEVYSLADPVEAPFAPAPMPSTATKEMLQLFVSDYVLNSATFALLKGGLLQYNITDQDLPSWSPIRLNTASWSFLLPQLASKYPNMAMVATIAATQAPVAKFTPQGLSELADGAIYFLVLPPNNGTAIPVFTLALNLTATVEMSVVNGTKLAGKLDSITPSISLQWSDVGDIPVSLLSSAIQMLVNALVPMANAYLATGYPLPSLPGLTLVQPTIGYGVDYMFVSSSFTYQPPTSAAIRAALAPPRSPVSITIN
jgi:lipopolysaccharide-binding protein